MKSRYSQFTLPHYAYLPGKNAKAQHGHLPEFNPNHHLELKDNPAYLYAIDLFNEQFYWEVHEILEPIWLSLEAGPKKDALQGIIILAAAKLKIILDQPEVATRLFQRSLSLLSPAAGSETYILTPRIHNCTLDDIQFLKLKGSVQSSGDE